MWPIRQSNGASPRRPFPICFTPILRKELPVPIRIADNLPARRTLEAEGVIVMGETEAARQDIRPLRIALLNLMPDKITTETQIARLLGATPLQIELTLVRLSGHVSKTTSAGHIAEFYRPFDEIQTERFDGLIITGAPVETMAYGEVTYWDELRRIFDWSQTHCHRLLTICWGRWPRFTISTACPSIRWRPRPMACSTMRCAPRAAPGCAACPMWCPCRFRAGARCASPTFPPG
jgi:hypothetical protein